MPSSARSAFDLEYCNNNGVTAVRPHPEGVLASLVQGERSWIFRNNVPKGISQEVQLLVLSTRSGDLNDLERFLDSCREKGLYVKSGSFFVPCSNGVKFIRPRNDSPLEWMEQDVAHLRTDAPSVVFTKV